MASLDIFVSFSSKNRDQIAPIVEALRQRKLTVWWSEDIEPGCLWDDKVDEHLIQAKYVLAFVTPEIDESNRDHIQVEFDDARSYGKLVPLVIGDGCSINSIRGIIYRLQNYFFKDFDSILDTKAFEKLVQVCGGMTSQNQSIESNIAQPSPLERVDKWYTEIEGRYGRTGRATIFSMAIAVAVLEHTPPSRVRQLAKHLENLVEGTTFSANPETNEGPHAPERLTPLLKEVDSRLTSDPQNPIGNDVSIVFDDPERASAMLEFAWVEFGDRRDALIQWLNDIVNTGVSDEVTRIGFSLGLLAQCHFEDLFDGLLFDWVYCSNNRQRYAADIALSVAAFEPQIARKIQDILDLWSSKGSAERVKMAIRLASGYTAMRLPNAAVKTFQTVAEKRHESLRKDVFEEMRDSLAALLRRHTANEASKSTKSNNNEIKSSPDSETKIVKDKGEDEFLLERIEDDSLFDLPGLIMKLADWVLESTGVPKTGELCTKVGDGPLIRRRFV